MPNPPSKTPSITTNHQHCEWNPKLPTYFNGHEWKFEWIAISEFVPHVADWIWEMEDIW